MPYVQVSIEAEENFQELLIAALYDFETVGFEQTSTHLLTYFSKKSFSLEKISQAIKGAAFEVKILEDQNWNEQWESNFSPVIINNFCGVRADFHPSFKNVAHEIIITPKMSFGTGHHATTSMMIEQMQGLQFKDKKVFDFGTGTGILAILAERLGAVKITAIDVDDWSITNANENIDRNNCKNIEVRHSDLLPREQFDIVLANINKNVILHSLPELKKCLDKDGLLLLSGLLATDQEEIISVCNEQHLALEKSIIKNNWISLLFVNSAEV